MWITKKLFEFIPQIDEPTGGIPYTAHRSHAVPSSIHIAVADPNVTMPAKTVDATTEQIAEDLRHLSVDQLTGRTLGGGCGVAKPLMISDGQTFDLQAVPKERIKKGRQQRKKMVATRNPAQERLTKSNESLS